MKSTIYHGDALRKMISLPDNGIDVLLTDIPYGHVNRESGGLRKLDKGFADWETFDLKEFAFQSIRITKQSGVIFCGKEQFSCLFQVFAESNLSPRMIIWEKTNPSPMNGQHLFLSGVECAVYFRKPKATFNGRCENTVFRYPHLTSSVHPTQKSERLFMDLIRLITNPDDLVFDPCMGSGTTAVACINLGRRFLCGDINPECVRMAYRRVEENMPELFKQ